MKLTKYLIVLLIIPASVFSQILLTSAIIGISSLGVGGGYIIFDKLKLNTYCKYAECCYPELIPHNLMLLKDKLDAKLFGQHIIEKELVKSIASFYASIDRTKKPLVMLFHGPAGTGKNYVSVMIAEAVFEKGTKSKYFHLFRGTQLSNQDKIHEQKEAIRKAIYDGVDQCAYSMFVFDEVDKMPTGIFDTITGLLDHHTLIKGKDFSKSIFLFLSNHGEKEIKTILHQLTTEKGLYRHNAELNHFEETMKIEAFNKEGGLQDSTLIRSEVIDFYFPFLPLEKSHVNECIKEEFKDCGKNDVSKDKIDRVMKHVVFDPKTNYANAGCKTIYGKVQTECFS